MPTVESNKRPAADQLRNTKKIIECENALHIWTDPLRYNNEKVAAFYNVHHPNGSIMQTADWGGCQKDTKHSLDHAIIRIDTRAV